MNLPGPLAKDNAEIDQLVIENERKASEFHKRHYGNNKGLQKDFSIIWQQSKKLRRKCPTCPYLGKQH